MIIQIAILDNDQHHTYYRYYYKYTMYCNNNIRKQYVCDSTYSSSSFSKLVDHPIDVCGKHGWKIPPIV